MSESENVLPLDSSFWEHCEHLDFTVGIPVSEKRTMDILQVMHDIYDCISEDSEEAKQLIISMAAILVASRYDKADLVWEEIVVQSSMKDVDKALKEIISEESK